MNLQLEHVSSGTKTERRSLWSDNRLWWVNCLAIERYWFYAGADLRAARARRDALLTDLLEKW